MENFLTIKKINDINNIEISNYSDSDIEILSYNTDDDIKNEFILRIDKNIKTITLNNKLLHKVNITDILNYYINQILSQYPTFKDNDKFIIVSSNLINTTFFDKNNIDGYNYTNSDIIEDSVIIGYKTNFEQPGIVMFLDNIKTKFSLVDVGFNYLIPYLKIKIENQDFKIDDKVICINDYDVVGFYEKFLKLKKEYIIKNTYKDFCEVIDSNGIQFDASKFCFLTSEEYIKYEFLLDMNF